MYSMYLFSTVDKCLCNRKVVNILVSEIPPPAPPMIRLRLCPIPPPPLAPSKVALWPCRFDPLLQISCWCFYNLLRESNDNDNIFTQKNVTTMTI